MKMMMKLLKYGRNQACRRRELLNSARMTTSGKSDQDHVDHVQNCILTEVKNMDVEVLTVNRAVTATDILNSGTMFSHSFQKKKTVHIAIQLIQTLTPVWAWKEWLALCRVQIPSLTLIQYVTSSMVQQKSQELNTKMDSFQQMFQ